MDKRKIYQPIIYAALIAAGIYIGMKMSEPFNGKNIFQSGTKQSRKINDVLNYINKQYVDTVNQNQLVENAIEDMLHHLDPHSAYIPAEELQAVNEPLEGNFEGIGIEFHIQQDTIMVVSALSGGPSEQLGIHSGDRIVKVDGKNVTGDSISNSKVLKLLRGQGGTKVLVSILRRGNSKLIDFNITRDKIPIYSVDAGYMVNDVTGCIKISHFAEHTYEEFVDAFNKIKADGMQNLILDLRGNPGGYLKTAAQIADEFLSDGKLIVYTQGRVHPKEIYKATSAGNFEKGKLIVLIDEGSASASEIVAGALQDNDRAIIAGRRSFGKGLVQEQSDFSDGSAIRLTIARYYTPSGRCIQKPYTDGYDDYENELSTRYKKGELNSKDSIHFADSLKYKTTGGRIVYGGGGIMPDEFIPLDTTGNSRFFTEVSATGTLNQFAYDYLDANRKMFQQFRDFEEFDKKFSVNDEVYNQFIAAASKNKIARDDKGVKISSTLIRFQIKALIARQLFRNEGYYRVVKQIDATLLRATQLLNNDSLSVFQ